MRYFYIFFCFMAGTVFGQETVYIDADGQVGVGVLKSRGSECFIITPKHVVENALNDVSVTGSKSVKSRAVLERAFSDDLALLRVTGGGTQNCKEWRSHKALDEVIEKSFEGVLEVKGSNGSNKLIKVLITEKEDTRFVVRPYFQDETILKGYSGSVLFTLHEGERVILGMLMEVDENGKGIVLSQKVINRNLDSFFNTSGASSNSDRAASQHTYIIPDTPDNVVESLGFSFKLVESTKRGGKIVVKFTVTALQKDNSLYITTRNSSPTTQVYDQMGNVYRVSQLKLGTLISQSDIGRNYTFAAGIPVPLELTIDNVLKETEGLALLNLFISTNGHDEFISFRNINFSNSTEKFKLLKPEGVQTQESLGFKFDLVDSKKNGNKLIVKLFITSLLKDNSLYITTRNSSPTTQVYDQMGNVYRVSQLKLGTLISQSDIGRNYTFAAGVAVPLELTIENVLSETEGITLLNLFISANGHDEFISFRNINFSNSTEKFKLLKPEGVQTQESLGFKFDLVDSKKNGNKLIVKLFITSLLKDNSLYITTRNSSPTTQVYDQIGNIYRVSQLKLGILNSQSDIGRNYIFPVGVAVPLELTIENVLLETKGITLLNLLVSANGHDEFISFRNINFSNSTEKFEILKPEGIQNQESLGFRFNLVGAKRNGDKVVLSILITSLSKDNSLYITTRNSRPTTQVYDKSGNVYRVSQLKLGSLISQSDIGRNYIFVKGVPVPLELSINSFNDDSIALLNLLISVEGNDKSVAFKNINLN